MQALHASLRREEAVRTILCEREHCCLLQQRDESCDWTPGSEGLHRGGEQLRHRERLLQLCEHRAKERLHAEQLCTVCQEPLLEVESHACHRCHHRVHVRCLRQWAVASFKPEDRASLVRCPSCRTPVPWIFVQFALAGCHPTEDGRKLVADPEFLLYGKWR